MPADKSIPMPRPKGLKENERKWGPPLMKAGWCLLPTTILTFQKELGLEPTDINILMHLISFWWYADRLPYPSKKRLADCMGVHKSTIQRRIRRMEEMGLIKRVERKEPERGQMTNFYDLDGLIKKATPLAKKALAAKEEGEPRARKKLKKAS